MAESLTITLNGQMRRFPEFQATAGLEQVIDSLGLKADRVAVELNGQIAPRAEWGSRSVVEGDRLEIVHFVGGGLSDAPSAWH